MLIGNKTRSTIYINNDSNQTNGQVVTVEPSVSLLIQSLIQKLCILSEENPVHRKKLYFGNSYMFLKKIKFDLFLSILNVVFVKL